MPSNSFRLTKISCYTGIFVQAIIANLTPVLFIPMMDLYGLSYTQLGVLVGINFVSQVLVDILFSGAIDKYGYRRLVLPAIACAFVGLLLFAASPLLFSGNVYVGLLLATIVFAAAGGLLEVMLSPIIHAIPTGDKASSMSLLHSFYAWGQVVVIVITTLFLFCFGAGNWQWMVLLWAIVPVAGFWLFFCSKFPEPVAEEEREKPKSLLFSPFFLIALAAIFFGAGTELVMAQWSSAYMERAVSLPKVAGDLLGMCGFAVTMGIGRTFYGVRGSRLNISHALILCSGFAAVCYLTVAFSPSSGLSILACALCGLGASILWPGTLVACSSRFPTAGAWMFAILAAAGDIGGAFGPWITGVIVDWFQSGPLSQFAAGLLGVNPEQSAMRIGMGIAALFPIGAFLCHLFLSRMLTRWRKNRGKDGKESL